MLDVSMGLDVMCFNGPGHVSNIFMVEEDRSSLKGFEETLAEMAEVDVDDNNVYRIQSKDGKYVFINCSVNGIVFGTDMQIDE